MRSATNSPFLGRLFACRLFACHLFVCCLLLGGLVARAPSAAAAERTTLGRPGYLVIEGVRDSSAVFTWQEGPGPGRHSLVWPEGTLSLPSGQNLDDYGRLDAGVACGAELSGVGGSGHLVFNDGLYVVSEPIVLADGTLELHVSAGELEIRSNQIRYRRPVIEDHSSQANYIFLAGLVVLIVVLMRRVRKRLRKS